MAWIYIESLPASSGQRHTIVYRRKTSATSGGYWFNLRNNGGTQQLEFVATDSSGSDFLVQTHTMTTGRWYHVAAVWDSADGDVDFYVDGLNIGNVAGSKSTLNAQSETFYLGASSGGSDEFDGLLDEVAVFNTNLSATTLQGYFRGKLTGSETNLQAYWELDNDYTDTHANGNDLTASGSPVFSTTVPFTGATGVSNTTALSTNLEAYYELEESSGTRVDSVASYDLTDNNTVAQGTGKQGDCADFELSNSEYLNHATTDTALNPSGANLFTVAGWFNCESQSATHVIAVNKKTNNSVGDCYKIYVTSDGSVVCQTWASSGSFLTIDSGIDVGTAEWHHVAFVKHATNDWRVYVDGILRATSTSTRSNASTGLNGISVGAEDTGSSGVINYFDGLIDELGVWSGALSQTDILDLYANGDGIPYAGGTAYTQSVNETLTLAATIENEGQKDLGESITLADTVSRDMQKTISDVVTLVDTIDTAQVFTEQLDEALSLVDSAAKITGKTLAEAVTLVDTLVRDMQRTLTETATLVETTDALKTYVREYDETITIVDSTIRQVGKTITDVLLLADSLERTITYNRDLDETLALVDTVARVTPSVLDDAITLADTLAKVGTFARDLDETITLEQRFQGLINGQDISWFRKYAEQTGTWIRKYLAIP